MVLRDLSTFTTALQAGCQSEMEQFEAATDCLLEGHTAKLSITFLPPSSTTTPATSPPRTCKYCSLRFSVQQLISDQARCQPSY